MADPALAPSPRQLAVLRLIFDGRRQHGHPPTIRELGDALGVRSTNAVADHLRALRKKGLVFWQPTKGRTLAVTAAGHRWVAGQRQEAA